FAPSPRMAIRGSAFRAGDDREVMAFAASAQRIVLAQRKTRELVRHQDAAQVRVSLEDNAVHVVDFTLEPVPRLPELERRRQTGVGFIDEGPDANTFADY